MPFTDDQIIGIVLQNEGGFTNNPADRGGPTNFGITAATLGRFRNLRRSATVDEVRALTRKEAIEIYTKNYIVQPGFSAIKSDPLRLVLVDSGVLYGPARAISWLRLSLKLPPAPISESQLSQSVADTANAAANATLLPVIVLSQRLKTTTSIVSKNKKQIVFLAGWVNRVASLLDEVV